MDSLMLTKVEDFIFQWLSAQRTQSCPAPLLPEPALRSRVCSWFSGDSGLNEALGKQVQGGPRMTPWRSLPATIPPQGLAPCQKTPWEGTCVCPFLSMTGHQEQTGRGVRPSGGHVAN